MPPMLGINRIADRVRRALIGAMSHVHANMGKAQMTDDQIVERGGDLAITRLHGLWQSYIHDPKYGTRREDPYPFDRIEDCYQGGLGWPVTYLGDDHGQQWCGAAAMFAWAAAGLAPYWRMYFGASTDRLDAFGAYRPWVSDGKVRKNSRPPDGDHKRVYVKCDETMTPALLAALVKPQKGDILLVGSPTSHRKWGTHIVLVEEYDPGNGLFKTIGGNGKGRFPDGSRGEGLVKADFQLGALSPEYHVRRIIRPAASDLEPPP